MKYLIDTNVIMDSIFMREPFLEASEKILNKCATREISGYITSNAVTDIYYLTHQAVHDHKRTHKVLERILKFLPILPVASEDVLTALHKKSHDFEDDLASVVAQINGCFTVITRNPEDFKDSPLKAITPTEFLNKHHK